MISKKLQIFAEEIGISTKILFGREVEGVDALKLDASLDDIIKEVKTASETLVEKKKKPTEALSLKKLSEIYLELSKKYRKAAGGFKKRSRRL